MNPGNYGQSCTCRIVHRFKKKAFDTVHHTCLLTKLPCSGINNKERLFTDNFFNSN